jgi:hypothetical protein
MEEERDLVTFTDDDGNEFTLDVIDYFEYEDEEYAVLMDLSESDEESDDADDTEEQDVYIMKIVVNGEMEEFLPADDDKMDVLAAIAEKRLNEGCGCGCDECNDEEEHEHHHCGCDHCED